MPEKITFAIIPKSTGNAKNNTNLSRELTKTNKAIIRITLLEIAT